MHYTHNCFDIKDTRQRVDVFNNFLDLKTEIGKQRGTQRRQVDQKFALYIFRLVCITYVLLPKLDYDVRVVSFCCFYEYCM